MIKMIPWRKVPAQPLVGTLPELKWVASNGTPASRCTAALMLYTALNLMGEVVTHGDDITETVADPSYDDLHAATGLSRALISAGLGVLREIGLVQAEGSMQRRKYRIIWAGGGWFKLPCRAIINGSQGEITPFKAFNLRSRYELHALKLYLYIASCRDNITHAVLNGQLRANL